MRKVRLDQLLVSRGLAPSRERAKAYIMEGFVLVDQERADKAGDMVSPDANIILKQKLPYVSRGGLKLEKAMNLAPFSIDDKVCADIGASTGGFTDCMLQHGAKRVYAVDVGYGQLAWKLRNDARVVNLERTNARYLTKEQIPELLDFVSVDVSFISLKLILPVVFGLLKDHGHAVVLVKPQFEAGRDRVGKKGVVRDPVVHEDVLRSIYDCCVGMKFCVLAMDFSPVKGPEGNIEYLFVLEKSSALSCKQEQISELVSQSHMQLNGAKA